MVVEVLSTTTEAYDRGEKFAHYRRIPSLRDYVLVSQTAPSVEVYSRDGDTWVLRTSAAGESVPVAALGGLIVVDRLYAGIALDGERSGTRG